jgi:ATP phosphoribosyltransferase regulatory subunit
MTLYPEAVLRAAPRQPSAPRCFVPAGEPGAATLRAQGYVTVAALSAADTPEGLRCTHILRDGQAVPLKKD